MMRLDFVAALGALCVSAAMTGASSALTVIPPWIVLGAGAVLCAPSSLRGRTPHAGMPSILAGVALSLLLPTSPPPIGGSVITSAAGTGAAGDLFDVLNRIDRDPAGVIGRSVSVSGEWSPPSGDRMATVSRRVMSCCAADAVAVGFDVDAARPRHIAKGTWVRVRGIVRARMTDGEERFSLEQSVVTGLED